MKFGVNRSEAFYVLKKYIDPIEKINTDRLCLQETYIKSDTIHDIKREWRGQVFHRHRTSRSNDLLILIGTKLMNEETESVKVIDRILIIKITINNVVHTVVNCYEPNTRIEKDQLSTSTSRGTTRYRN